jgi:hypothetical protein
MSIDEMAIKRHVIWQKESQQFLGQVSFSQNIDDLATKVIVFLLTAMNSNWKVPVGYFFTNGLDHQKRAVLLDECFKFLKNIEADFATVTFDGDPANLKMVEVFGNDNLSKTKLILIKHSNN